MCIVCILQREFALVKYLIVGVDGLANDVCCACLLICGLEHGLEHISVIRGFKCPHIFLYSSRHPPETGMGGVGNKKVMSKHYLINL